MAVNYGDLFGFIGLWVKAGNNVAALYSTLETDEDDLTSSNAFGIGTELNNFIYSVPQGFNSIRSAVSAFNQYAASQIQQILMSRDAVRLELNLGDYEQFQTIINALMNDMVANGESVSESAVTIGAVSKNTINSDTGFLYADKQLDGVTPPIRGGAAYDHYVGTESQLAVASDDLTIRCTLDADAINGVGGLEQWQISGSPSTNTKFGWQSEGSGNGPTMTTQSPYNSFIPNSSFESWSGTNLLSNWTYVTGAATTNYVREQSDSITGTYSLQMKANDDLTSVEMTCPAPTVLQARKRYVLGLWVKGDAANTGGSLRVEFKGTGYSAAADEGISLDDSDLQDPTWKHYACFITIPTNIPDDFELSVEIGVDGSNNKFKGEILLDDLVLGVPTYHGGIAYAVFKGKEKFLYNDEFTLTVTNDDASPFNAFFRKAFLLQLPSSNSPTIADALAQ